MAPPAAGRRREARWRRFAPGPPRSRPSRTAAVIPSDKLARAPLLLAEAMIGRAGAFASIPARAKNAADDTSRARQGSPYRTTRGDAGKPRAVACRHRSSEARAPYNAGLAVHASLEVCVMRRARAPRMALALFLLAVL